MRLQALALATAVALIPAMAAHAQGGRLIFATQESGTMFFTVGSGMAKMLGDKLGRRVAVQPYTGSSVYLPLLDNGEVHLAFSSNLDVDAAWRGTDRAPLRNLRSVARIWPLRVALMVRADSGIKSAKDLRGKRVTWELKGQRAMGNVIRGMVMTAGLEEKDIKPVTVANVGEGAKMLTEGNLDAAFVAMGIPIVKQAHSAIPGGIAYVDLAGGDTSEALIGKFAPGTYATRVEPSAAMPEVTAPLMTAAFDVFLITGAALPEAEIAAVVKALDESFAELQKDFPPLRTGDPARFAASTNTAPFHPGAVGQFRASGRWTDVNEARDKDMTK